MNRRDVRHRQKITMGCKEDPDDADQICRVYL